MTTAAKIQRDQNIGFLSYIQSYFKKSDGYRPKRYNAESFKETCKEVVLDIKNTMGEDTARTVLKRLKGAK